MRLWSIQTEQAFRLFKRRGVLRGDDRRTDREFRHAYAWMTRQMSERLGKPPHRCKAPVWAWKVWSSRSAKPDLRSGSHLPCGTAGVRIEFEASPGTVLLSDFTRWHNVLNGVFLPDAEDDKEPPVEWESNREACIERSWERIFELERGDPDFFGPVSSRGIQATLWQIEWRQVRNVTRFTAR